MVVDIHNTIINFRKVCTCHLFTAEGTADELLLVDGGRDGACHNYMNNKNTREDCNTVYWPTLTCR